MPLTTLEAQTLLAADLTLPLTLTPTQRQDIYDVIAAEANGRATAEFDLSVATANIVALTSERDDNTAEREACIEVLRPFVRIANLPSSGALPTGIEIWRLCRAVLPAWRAVTKTQTDKRTSGS